MTKNPYGENKILMCDNCKERPAKVFTEVGRQWYYLCIECKDIKALTPTKKCDILSNQKESK